MPQGSTQLLLPSVDGPHARESKPARGIDWDDATHQACYAERPEHPSSDSGPAECIFRYEQALPPDSPAAPGTIEVYVELPNHPGLLAESASIQDLGQVHLCPDVFGRLLVVVFSPTVITPFREGEEIHHQCSMFVTAARLKPLRHLIEESARPPIPPSNCCEPGRFHQGSGSDNGVASEQSSEVSIEDIKGLDRWDEGEALPTPIRPLSQPTSGLRKAPPISLSSTAAPTRS